MRVTSINSPKLAAYDTKLSKMVTGGKLLKSGGYTPSAGNTGGSASGGMSAANVAAMMGQAFGLLGSFAGSFYSAKAQKSNLQHQARMAEINARIAETGAKTELARGQAEYARHTLQAGHLKSAQRAALAANGIVMNEGSAAEMLATTDIMKEIDAQTIEENALRNAWGYRSQATDYRNQALMGQAQASSINPAGAGLQTLLGSAPMVAEYWDKYSRQKGIGIGKLSAEEKRLLGSNNYGRTSRIHTLTKMRHSRKQGSYDADTNL
jgi:hypothetical protein|nr:MAG TPA: hypothetical protein [Caudoviricetes sp.]